MNINDLQRLRDQAEAATDLLEIWKATLGEVALRWEFAGKPSQAPVREGFLFDKIRIAIRKDNRVDAISYIEQWRSAWLKLLKQRDHTSSAKLNVIDSFRRVR
jgi:hypothetical protein